MYSLIVLSVMATVEPSYREKHVVHGRAVASASAGCQGFHATYAVPVQGFRASGCAGGQGGYTVTYSTPMASYAASPAYGFYASSFSGARHVRHKERHSARHHKSKTRAHGRVNPVPQAMMQIQPRQVMPQSTCPTCPGYVPPIQSKKPVQ